mmetsp:Transcript_22889/g.35828  ORF Transcript_22889/g.35828 Transcript_22889/m.35828 type:complete len:133 (+) Transcript_22889:411-809(+)
MAGRLEYNTEAATYFKLVAVDEDESRFVSIFDGRTEYRVGETVQDEVRAGHKGGIYVCESLLDLLKLGPLPSKSAMIDNPWAVVQLTGWGNKLRYNELSGGTKVAISSVSLGLCCSLSKTQVLSEMQSILTR